MSKHICASCRAFLRRTLRSQDHAIPSTRPYSTTKPLHNKSQRIDIAALLSKPTWSVRSLLPDASTPPSTEITSAKLHHLLRLSALPLPRSPLEEERMLATLHSQLHFVKGIQTVNTDGIAPLQSIRDETEKGIKEITIGLKDLEDALKTEDVVGRNKRPRRRREEKVETGGVEDWDVLATAGEKVEVSGGRYFVVRSGKDGEVEAVGKEHGLPVITGKKNSKTLYEFVT